MTKTDKQLEVIGLGCVRSERSLFQDLSFTLSSGEVLQVRGTNGSGKSSLLRILCGLLPPEQGEVHWNGEDIFAERQEYLCGLAYLGHLHGMKDDLTVYENVNSSMALGVLHCGVDEINEALQKLELTHYAEVLTRKLSAGQKRRVALTRFLLTRASLWIMDEPFTSLDDAGKKLVCSLISEHVSKGGICIVATHEPLQLADLKVKGLDL